MRNSPAVNGRLENRPNKRLDQRIRKRTQWLKWGVPMTAILCGLSLYFTVPSELSDSLSISSVAQGSKARLLGYLGTEPAGKDHQLGRHAHDGTLVHTEKLGSPLTLELETLDGMTKEAGQVFVLRAKFVSTVAFSEVFVRWNFEDGVELLSGLKEETLVNIKANEKKIIEVTLVQEDDSNRKVHVNISAGSGGSQYSAVAQFNTTRQESINASKEALKERAAASIKKHLKKVYK